MSAGDLTLTVLVWMAIATILIVIVATYQWVVVRHAASRAQLDALEARTNQRIADMPTHKDLAEIGAMVTRIGGDVRNLKTQGDAIERTLHMLVQHHINPEHD